MQLDLAIHDPEALHREVGVDPDDHDLAVPRGLRAVDDQGVARGEPGVDHRVAGHVHAEGRVRVRGEELVEVEAVLLVVARGGREPGLHPFEEEVDLVVRGVVRDGPGGRRAAVKLHLVPVDRVRLERRSDAVQHLAEPLAAARRVVRELLVRGDVHLELRAEAMALPARARTVSAPARVQFLVALLLFPSSHLFKPPSPFGSDRLKYWNGLKGQNSGAAGLCP